MTRIRLSVDVDPELRRQVKMVAASKDQSVKEWIESAIKRELLAEMRESSGRVPSGAGTREDRAWFESDLSRLGEFEPYEWAKGELDEGEPVRRRSDAGAVVDNDVPYGDR